MPVHPFLVIFVVISVHVDGDLHNDTTIRAVLAKKFMLQLQAIVITDHIKLHSTVKYMDPTFLKQCILRSYHFQCG